MPDETCSRCGRDGQMARSPIGCAIEGCPILRARDAEDAAKRAAGELPPVVFSRAELPDRWRDWDPTLSGVAAAHWRGVGPIVEAIAEEMRQHLGSIDIALGQHQVAGTVETDVTVVATKRVGRHSVTHRWRLSELRSVGPAGARRAVRVLVGELNAALRTEEL